MAGAIGVKHRGAVPAGLTSCYCVRHHGWERRSLRKRGRGLS